MKFLLSVIVFLFLFWLLTSKFPKIGKGITSTGDKCYHGMVDKKHISKNGDNVSILDIMLSGFKKFGKWFKGLFKKRSKKEIK